MQALCEAVLPPVEGVQHAPERITAILMRQADFMTPLLRLSFLLGLRLLEWSPLLLLQSRRRFSRLPVEKRRELFERCHHSRLYQRRQLALGYGGPMFMAFYDLPEVRSAVQYPIEAFVSERRKHWAGLMEADRAEGREAPRSQAQVRV